MNWGVVGALLGIVGLGFGAGAFVTVSELEMVKMRSSIKNLEKRLSSFPKRIDTGHLTFRGSEQDLCHEFNPPMTSAPRVVFGSQYNQSNSNFEAVAAMTHTPTNKEFCVRLIKLTDRSHAAGIVSWVAVQE